MSMPVSICFVIFLNIFFSFRDVEGVMSPVWKRTGFPVLNPPVKALHPRYLALQCVLNHLSFSFARYTTTPILEDLNDEEEADDVPPVGPKKKQKGKQKQAAKEIESEEEDADDEVAPKQKQKGKQKHAANKIESEKEIESSSRSKDRVEKNRETIVNSGKVIKAIWIKRENNLERNRAAAYFIQSECRVDNSVHYPGVSDYGGGVTKLSSKKRKIRVVETHSDK